MSILSKGYAFTSTDQVTSTKLGNLVDNATFASGAVDNASTELSGGALVIKNGGITTSKLSSGAPTWDISGNTTITGTITSGGTISTSNSIEAAQNLTVNGTSTLIGAVTCSGQIIQSGTTSGRTVQFRTGSSTPNAISFGWDTGDLLITVDGTTYSITATPV